MADYIKREDALSAILGAPPDAHYPEWYASILAKLPAADVAPVQHGCWSGEGDGYADGELVFDVWHCSNCDHCIDDGTDDPERLPNYCPNCGAKMNGGTDNVSD